MSCGTRSPAAAGHRHHSRWTVNTRGGLAGPPGRRIRTSTSQWPPADGGVRGFWPHDASHRGSSRHRGAGSLGDTIFMYVVATTAPPRRARSRRLELAVVPERVPEDPEWLHEHIDDFGSSQVREPLQRAWAWGLDAPFPVDQAGGSHFRRYPQRHGRQLANGIKGAAVGCAGQFHHGDRRDAHLLEAAASPPDVGDGVAQSRSRHELLYSFGDQGRRAPPDPVLRSSPPGIYDGWLDRVVLPRSCAVSARRPADRRSPGSVGAVQPREDFSHRSTWRQPSRRSSRSSRSCSTRSPQVRPCTRSTARRPRARCRSTGPA